MNVFGILQWIDMPQFTRFMISLINVSNPTPSIVCKQYRL
jgi:hypothetical protein